jgi:hypothetical protein
VRSATVAAVAPAGVSLAVTNAGTAIPDLMRSLDGNGLHVAGVQTTGLQTTSLQTTRPSFDDVFTKYADG